MILPERSAGASPALDPRHLAPFVWKWEGGPSRSPLDLAARQSPLPPELGGIHTNRGVVWATYVALAGSAGYRPTPQDFLAMPDDLWHRIWLHGFWRPIEPDLWAHQPLADLVAYWAWGSGLHTAIRQVQRVVNRLHGTALTEDGVLGPRTRAAVRRAVASDWQQLYRELALQRCVFVAGVVRSRPEQLAHLAGWLRALTDFLLFQGVCVR